MSLGFRFKREDIRNLVATGHGSFGTVYSANLPGHGNVTVKRMKTYPAYRDYRRLKGVEHRNILKLIGIVPEGKKNIPWLIFENMPMGNLLDYVQLYATGGCPATWQVGMRKMAYGIAIGMNYLHRNCNLVHRDLAARNILVGAKWSVKIGDFGLCNSSIEKKHYYADGQGNGRPWPIRWMPPENLPTTGRKFSRKGDVWSFGVVLFEIWSRGKLPYDGVGNDKNIMDAIIKGNNPLDYTPISVSAPYYIRKMMKRCWNYESNDRPNFQRLILNLKKNIHEPSLLGYSSSDSDSDSSSDYYMLEEKSQHSGSLATNDFFLAAFTKTGKKEKGRQNKLEKTEKMGERREKKKGKKERKKENTKKFDIME